MCKKLLAIILAIGMVCASSVFAVAEESDTEEVNILTESPLDAIVASLDKEWYGGIYFEGENVVHFVATEGNAANIQALLNAQRSAGREYTYVVDDPTSERSMDRVYSIVELEDAKEELKAVASELGIAAVGLNAKGNALGVYLADYENTTDEQKSDIIAASSVKHIIFRNGAIFVDEKDNESKEHSESVNDEPSMEKDPKLTMYGGNWLARNNSDWSTLGTSAVYDWEGPNQMLGFITCGHGWTLGQPVYYRGTKIGAVRIINNEGGDADFAFVESSYNTRGYMTDGSRLTSKENPYEGLTVKCYGAKSGIKNGKILDTNIDDWWGTEPNTYNYYDLFSTTIPTKVGDSGAAFTSAGKNLVGLMKGGLNGYDISVGTKVYNIINGWDVQPST